MRSRQLLHNRLKILCILANFIRELQNIDSHDVLAICRRRFGRAAAR